MAHQTAKSKANGDRAETCTCGHAKDKHIAGRLDCPHWSNATGRYCPCVAYQPEPKGK